MGTICGIYYKKHKDCSGIEINGNKMMALLTQFPHDTAASWQGQRVFFGNTGNYFTPESRHETLPRFVDYAKIAITADAIIDNREDLLSEFNIAEKDALFTSDSELIAQAYLKWGSACPKHLVGDYAFAVWDESRETLFCARDHVGKRTLYYYHDNEKIAFCTTIKPLLALKENQRELNEEWIANNLATAIPLNQLDTYSTVYKDIFQLPPAHTMLVMEKGVKLNKYWHPLKIPKLKLDSDGAYEEAFRQVFFEAVSCRLRGMGSTGIMLSGGLDSGSIACIAAPMLKQRGKVLRAYTAVPFKDYEDWLGKGALADEREYIQTILNQYDNIDISFCDSEGINSYNSLDRLIELLEFPFKYFQNLFWLDNIARLARADSCTMLLDGQAGNYTVSLGQMDSYFISLIAKGKLYSVLQEAKHYSRAHNLNYSSVLKGLFSMLLPAGAIKICRYLRQRGDYMDRHNPRALINPRFASLWKTDKKLKRYKLGRHHHAFGSIKETHKLTASALLFSQVAEAEVKLSLAHGITKRDPTRDKRVVEFCMSLPEEQLVHKGVERSLIRRAMKDILPDQIRLNSKVRGFQSADWTQRMRAEWEQIRGELSAALENADIKKYMDTDYGRSLLEGMDEAPHDELYYKAQMILSVIAWKRFIQM